MERLIHVIYVSSTVSASAEHDALKFLGQARTANRKHDVSGLMLFVGGHFLQLLEGEPARVDVVCSTIFRDKRDMRMILRESIPERQFPEWTMGFEAVRPAEVCRLLDESTLAGSVANPPSMAGRSCRNVPRHPRSQLTAAVPGAPIS